MPFRDEPMMMDHSIHHIVVINVAVGYRIMYFADNLQVTFSPFSL